MNTPTCPSFRIRWVAVAVFAIAFAWIEAAIVFYLRTLVDRVEPYQSNPLPLMDGMMWVEHVREAATMVVLGAAGFLAGRNLVSRLGYALIAFGIWDIFYYVFLVPMSGWPNSILDWDILFLIPFPWWGPVLAPMLIALLMIAWGTLVTRVEALQSRALADWRVLAIGATGVLLGLYTFMADAIRVGLQGGAALREVLPTRFNWPVFSLALVFLSAPIAHLVLICVRKERAQSSFISTALD